MSDPFKREDSAREQGHCRGDLVGILTWCDLIGGLGCVALDNLDAGEIDRTMRVVQRIRSQLQFHADMMQVLLGDLHFVATGIDEFDHEEWLSATGEHDYSALEFAVNTERETGYMLGAGLLEGGNE